jgi:hypothetical protein
MKVGAMEGLDSWWEGSAARGGRGRPRGEVKVGEFRDQSLRLPPDKSTPARHTADHQGTPPEAPLVPAVASRTVLRRRQLCREFWGLGFFIILSPFLGQFDRDFGLLDF